MNNNKKISIQKRQLLEEIKASQTKTKFRKAFDFTCSFPIWKRLFKQNCENLTINHTTIKLDNLPIEFNGYKILFITDMHLEITPNPMPALLDMDLPQYDIVVLGGDFFDKSTDINYDLLTSFLSKFNKPIYAVLGNHDSHSLIKILESLNVFVLMNESIVLKRNNAELLLTGIDDVAQFDTGMQYESALRDSQSFDGCKVLISHSPDFLVRSESLKYDLQLSGHTHGGQFKIFNYIIFSQADSRFAIAGSWNYKGLTGFTSTGFGSSGYPIRNIPPELAIIELSML